MITAHHLVVVVIHNTVPPHLEVITPDPPLEDVGMVMIGINVIIKTHLRLEVEMTDSRDISMIKVITVINDDTNMVGEG